MVVCHGSFIPLKTFIRPFFNIYVILRNGKGITVDVFGYHKKRVCFYPLLSQKDTVEYLHRLLLFAMQRSFFVVL